VDGEISRDSFTNGGSAVTRSMKLVAVGVVFAAGFVMVGVLVLSMSAETLDEVAEKFGVGESPIYEPPLPDYELPGFEGNAAVNILLGMTFTLLTLLVTFLIGKALKSKNLGRSSPGG